MYLFICPDTCDAFSDYDENRCGDLARCHHNWWFVVCHTYMYLIINHTNRYVKRILTSGYINHHWEAGTGFIPRSRLSRPQLDWWARLHRFRINTLLLQRDRKIPRVKTFGAKCINRLRSFRMIFVRSSRSPSSYLNKERWVLTD